MIIQTNLTPASPTGLETAAIELVRTDTNGQSRVVVQWEELRDRCGVAVGKPLDFVLFASLAYCTDKLASRSTPTTRDNWTRDLTLQVPVGAPAAWSRAAEHLGAALSFLTGDHWELEFAPLSGPLFRAATTGRRRRRPKPKIEGDAVCLLSGGLDSLIGAINWLEQNPGRKLLAVGHHDRHVHGPFGDQRNLVGLLCREYPGRVDSLHVQVGQDPAGVEKSFRSRSLLFLALGVYAAQCLGPQVPLLVPENGTIAVNLPLTPSRRGSCSTRTTHPLFFALLREVLREVGIGTPISNPLEEKTKGECVAECRNAKLLEEAAPLTVSCAKAGHRSTWIRKNAKGCGRCVPCMFRRASLQKARQDTEPYGVDICRGEVDLRSRGESVNDFRAVVDFLRNHYTREQIADLLLASGGVPVERLDSVSDLIFRAMEEVRALLMTKGSAQVRAWIA